MYDTQNHQDNQFRKQSGILRSGAARFVSIPKGGLGHRKKKLLFAKNGEIGRKDDISYVEKFLNNCD
jgi:hypothetical protein